MPRLMNPLLVLPGLLLISAGVCAQPIAIVGATIIDGNGGAPIENGVVMVEGKRIAAVGGKSTAIPGQATKIAAAGKYVIPGLMDANVHLVLDNVPFNLIRFEHQLDELVIEAAQLALRGGVTTVFDSWGPRAALVKARDAINSGRESGARIYLAGNIVGMGGPYSEDSWGQTFNGKPLVDRSQPGFGAFADRIDAEWQENVGPELTFMTPEQVRDEIRAYLGKGVDFVKYLATNHSGRSSAQYVAFSPRVQQVIVEEAHRAGITAQTHTSSPEGLYLAIQAGVDLLQHCEVTGLQPIPAETMALLVERRVACAILPGTDKARAWRREKSGEKTPSNEELNQRALIRSGAVILLSTDAGVFGPATVNSAFWKSAYPPDENLLILGDGHFNWLLAVEQMGMKPMDGLLAATRNIAKAYKVDKDLGTLEKGKLADLLILDRNPLQSAANYRSVSLIMKEGAVVDRAALPTRKLLTAQP